MNAINNGMQRLLLVIYRFQKMHERVVIHFPLIYLFFIQKSIDYRIQFQHCQISLLITRKNPDTESKTIARILMQVLAYLADSKPKILNVTRQTNIEQIQAYSNKTDNKKQYFVGKMLQTERIEVNFPVYSCHYKVCKCQRLGRYYPSLPSSNDLDSCFKKTVSKIRIIKKGNRNNKLMPKTNNLR